MQLAAPIAAPATYIARCDAEPAAGRLSAIASAGRSGVSVSAMASARGFQECTRRVLACA